ncbi:MAG: hypothetical protein ABH870_04610 [bacterium]
MEKTKRWIISLIFISLLFPNIGFGEIDGTISATWIREDFIRSLLIDEKRGEIMKDNIVPKWIPYSEMVIYKSREEKPYLYYIDCGISPSIVCICEGEVENLSFIPLSENKNAKKIIFTLGVDLMSSEISKNIKPSFLLSLEKKVDGNIVFLRHKRTNTLFYLREDGKIMGTSTAIEDKNWASVVNINGDCSRDKKIAFISTLAGTDGDLYTFELPKEGEMIDLSRITRLTFDNSMEEMNPKWSPDGKSIIYSSFKGNNMDIYLIDANIGTTAQGIKTQLTTNTTTYECNPTFSPDGKMIAYYSTKDGVIYDLWVMKNNGEDKKKIADNVLKTDIYGPCWLPYGTTTLIYIYATQDRIEVEDVITNNKKIVYTEERLMSDIDAFYYDGEAGKEIFIAYSAMDNYTKRKRIFIKEFKVLDLPR